MNSRALYGLLLLSLLGFAFPGKAQLRTPKYANEFLTLGVGARGMAMSQAVVASVSDVSAAYWNPAGLVHVPETYQGSLMHTGYFAGIANYDYAGFTLPVKDSARLAFTLLRFAVDDIPDTRFLYNANGAIDYQNIQFFSAADYAFLMSYAQPLSFLPGLSVGGNVKVIYRQVGAFANAWGIGLDVAAQWRHRHLSVGAVLRDVSGTYVTWWHHNELLREVYDQTGNILPSTNTEVSLPRLAIGGAYHFHLPYDITASPELEADITFDGSRNVLYSAKPLAIDPHVGLELAYKSLFYIRGGYGNFQQVEDFQGNKSWTSQVNLGAGVHYKWLQLDYALTDLGDLAPGLYSHVFSIIVGINEKANAQ